MSSDTSRDKILIKTSWVSTIGNSILSLSRIVVGIISIVMIFTSRIISLPPSRKYVYGYEKAEGIATKVLSMVIFYAGIQMLISSGKSLLNAEVKEMPGTLAIYVTVISILGKLLLFMYQYRQGKKVNSSLLIANAKNMRNDVVISVGVLIGLFFTFVLNIPILDSVTGLIISIFIIKSSITIFIESNIELMDGVKDITIYDKIFDAVKKVPGATNPHRVRSRQIGNMYMIALDIEADGSITLMEAHTLAEKVERNIKDSIENVYDIIVHVEPTGYCSEDEKFGVDEKMMKG